MPSFVFMYLNKLIIFIKLILINTEEVFDIFSPSKEDHTSVKFENHQSSLLLPTQVPKHL
jgi:hypothetical protein